MGLLKFTFVLIAMAAMVSLAVTASVVAHRESTERSPAENFVSAVTISSGSQQIGSGVILNKRWIITSARCLENYTAKAQLRLHYGSHDRSDSNQMHGEVEQIVIHPKYMQERLVNNVALIKVKHDIELSATVQAATLPTIDTEEDELAYAIGWENTATKPNTLKYYQTTVMALDLCWERLEDLDAVKVNDNVICTYGPPDGAVIAMDHGSALVSLDKNELIGIGSWNEQGYPNVYARVRSNLPWIEPVIAL